MDKLTYGIPVFLVLVAVFVMFFISFIGAGHVGVVYSIDGGVQPQEFGEGMNFKMPWQFITAYSVRTQDYTMSMAQGEGQRIGNDAIDALTKEGLTVSLDMTVLYRLQADKASDIHQTVGERYSEVIVRPIIRTAIRNVVANYEAKQIYSSDRKNIELGIAQEITQKLSKKGIIVESVLLRNVKLPLKVAGAIEAKLEAEQQSEQMKFVLEKETQEAERKRVEARGIADAQAIIDKSLTSQYLSWYWIENLKNHNSVLYVPVGNNGMPLFKEVTEPVKANNTE